ncbi:MAG: hypothetical protein DRP66_04870 [Planctomycetota bacterium]|nr:MAG: hypothetical protein DRP66_04870 [Planctomycetota bacterium]
MKSKTSSKAVALGARTVEVAGLGSVLLAKSRKARRLSMTVRPHKGIRVAVPYRTSFEEGMAFLESNIGWARKNLDRVRRIERQHRTALSNLAPINRAAARVVLVKRLDELAREHGFAYNRVFIRNQKTRWGSCSENNNINLNVNLVRLRPGLMDYVILHELVHTREKNHGRRFWSRLDKLAGDAKTLDRELKKHVLGLDVY